ncbi:hypothetical protein D3C77_537760 [compost metagenome]
MVFIPSTSTSRRSGVQSKIPRSVYKLSPDLPIPPGKIQVLEMVAIAPLANFMDTVPTSGTVTPSYFFPITRFAKFAYTSVTSPAVYLSKSTICVVCSINCPPDNSCFLHHATPGISPIHAPSASPTVEPSINSFII